MKRFTLVELMIVISIIGILASVLLPSLTKAREKAMFSICTSHQSRIYRAMFMGIKNHDNLTPVIRDGNWTNPQNPRWEHDDWLGASRPNNGQLINGVIEDYFPDYKEYLRCPSLPTGEPGDRKGSNGIYDYTFLPSIGRFDIFKIPEEMMWNGRTLPVPYVVEENPESINGWNQESAFAASDKLGSWHDFGRKGGYTAIDGHSETVYDHGDTFQPHFLQVDYNGEKKVLNFLNSVELWPRPWD